MTRLISSKRAAGQAFAWGAGIGVLGGLVGLGGAEFRVPVLLGIFRVPPARTVVMNLMISLVTVVFSFIFRSSLADNTSPLPYAPIVLNILIGSLAGAFAGAHLTARLSDNSLRRAISLCLAGLGILLISHAVIEPSRVVTMAGAPQVIAGLAAGAVIGLTSSLLGVAGGEMIIPTLILLFAVDVKLAGSLSLLISIPTLLVGLARYHALGRVHDVLTDPGIILGLAGGSIVGALIGSALLPYVPGSLLAAFLGIILLLSAGRLFIHRDTHA